VTGRVEFDILARDHASGTLARIGEAFRKISRDADDSGKRTGEGFGSGFKKWFTGNGGTTSARAADHLETVA
jgi:hypothetical protein